MNFAKHSEEFLGRAGVQKVSAPSLLASSAILQILSGPQLDDPVLQRGAHLRPLRPRPRRIAPSLGPGAHHPRWPRNLCVSPSSLIGRLQLTVCADGLPSTTPTRQTVPVTSVSRSPGEYLLDACP
jgi:hypothetical protein